MSSKMNKQQQQQQKQKEETQTEGWNLIKPTKKLQYDNLKDQSEHSESQLSAADDQSGSDNNDKESDNEGDGGFISVDKKQRKQYENSLSNSSNNINIADGASSKQNAAKKHQAVIPPASIKLLSSSANANEALSLDKFNQFRERLNEQTKRYYYFDKQFFKIYNCPQINGLDMNQLLRLKDESSAIFIELRNIILSYINNNGGIVFFGFTSIKRDDCPHMEVNGFEISTKDRRRYDILQTAFKNIISRITPNSIKADLSIMKIRKDKNRNVSTHNNKYIARIVVQQGYELAVQYVYKESQNSQEISAKYSKKDQGFVVIKGQAGILQAQDQKKILVKVSELTVTSIDDFLDPNSSYKYSKNKYQGKNVRDASFLDDENEDDSSSNFTNNEDSNSQSGKSKELNWQDEHDDDKDKDVVSAGKVNEQLDCSSSEIASSNEATKQTNNALNNLDNFMDVSRNNMQLIKNNTVGAFNTENGFESQQGGTGLHCPTDHEASSNLGLGRSYSNQYILGIANYNNGQTNSAAQKADEYFGSLQSSFSTVDSQLHPSTKDTFWQSKLHSWQGSTNQNAFLQSKCRSYNESQGQNLQSYQQQLLFHNDLLANHSNSSQQDLNSLNQPQVLSGYQSQLQQQQQQSQHFLSTNLTTSGHVISQTSIESRIAKSLPYLSDIQLAEMINIVENQLQTYNNYLMLSLSEEQRRKKNNNSNSNSIINPPAVERK